VLFALLAGVLKAQCVRTRGAARRDLPPEKRGNLGGRMTWWNVLLDGAAHGCELPEDEPPDAGQERMLGDVFARIDEVATGHDGTPVIHATRLSAPAV
jgi:hypothetical protein